MVLWICWSMLQLLLTGLYGLVTFFIYSSNGLQIMFFYCEPERNLLKNLKILNIYFQMINSLTGSMCGSSDSETIFRHFCLSVHFRLRSTNIVGEKCLPVTVWLNSWKHQIQVISFSDMSFLLSSGDWSFGENADLYKHWMDWIDRSLIGQMCSWSNYNIKPTSINAIYMHVFILFNYPWLSLGVPYQISFRKTER